MAVECDYALTEDGKEISIRDAASGANGYFCLGCRRELVARIGKHNEPHFAHLALHKDTEQKCTYTNETHRHLKAKDILMLTKQVQVPAVYAAYPPDYTGRVPRLAKTATVIAASVLDERSVYINEAGAIKWTKKNQETAFDDKGGTWELLVRPDIIFLNAAGKPMLFIELAVTHLVSEKKLARLHLLKVDTIEIVIPKWIDPDHIGEIFTVTTNTQWLYNAQRAAFRFDPVTASSIGAGSLGVAELRGGIYEQGETIRCRRARLDNTLRHITKCLGRPDIRDFHAAFGDEERGVGESTAQLEQELRERDRKADEETASRVGRGRGNLTERQREARKQEAELDRRIRDKEKRLAKVTAYAKGRIERAKEQWRVDHHKTAGELREAEYQLGRDRHAREQEQRRLAGIRKELDRIAGELDDEESGIAAQEASIAIAQAAIGRNLSYLTGEIGRIDAETQRLESEEV